MNVTAICCGAARCWWTSAIPARARACCSFSSTQFRTPASPRAGERRVISKRMLYVEMDADGNARHLNYAPYLDYRPLAEGEPAIAAILARPECAWIGRGTWRRRRRATPSPTSCRSILPRSATRKLELLDKTEAAVKDRLTKEINYWDHRAEQLKEQEQAGKANARLNSGEARKRADELQARLAKAHGGDQARASDCRRCRPSFSAGLLVVPAGLIAAMGGRPPRHQRQTAGYPGRCRARARDRHGDRARARASSRSTARSKSSATTSKARCPAPGGCASSKSKGAWRRGHRHRDQERNSLFAQQAGRFHSRHRRVSRRTDRIGFTTCAGRSSANRTSASPASITISQNCLAARGHRSDRLAI